MYDALNKPWVLIATAFFAVLALCAMTLFHSLDLAKAEDAVGTPITVVSYSPSHR